MAWHPFCWGCFKFYPGDAPSDLIGSSGRPGHCPSCDRRLDMRDENHPPDIAEA
jgi:hypothetical protein